MSIDDADTLQVRLEREGADRWPLPAEAPVHHRISLWRAIRESDATVLRYACGWHRSEHHDREYVIDPLGERIADALADLIVGEEPEIDAPKITDTQPGPDGVPREVSRPGPDQELLDDLVDDNDLPSELQDAVSRCVGEGEVWWRIYVDRDAFEHPVIEWHSRDSVVPLWRGKKLLAVAFVSALDDLAPEAPIVRVGDDADPVGQQAWREGGPVTQTAADDGPVYRYVEIQTGGLTRNLLFRGERDKLGLRVPLIERAETADLPDEWNHGLEVHTAAGTPVPVTLAGRVTNGRAGRLGRSQYHGVKGLLFELNKIASVGSRNVDLTMHKRAVIDMDFAEPDRSDVDEGGAARGRARVRLPDTFLAPQDSMGGGDAMRVLEFSDAWAGAMISWAEHVEDKALTRARVAPQLVGRHTEGAQTGPSFRARLLDSILAANGKANAWLDELPKLLRAAQMVDALPEEQGGCGHQWSSPEELPTVKLSSVLPEDETDEVTRHVAAVAGEIEARRTAIEAWHPEWDADRVDRELELIRTEQPPPVVAPSIRTPRPPITLGGAVGAGNGVVPPGV
jgi:hypothetical protein